MQQTEHRTLQVLAHRFMGYIIRCEEILLSLFLLVMILLACYQIALRWFTSGGLIWIDPLLRYLVLWSGFLGAALATAKDEHISLDVIGYLLSDRVKNVIRIVTSCFSTIVALFLFRATLLFIQSEIEFGGNGLFGLPFWGWNLIFPIAFAMICFHFGVATFQALMTFFSPARPIESK
jgi:TRAP-type C4-dicarboxylate transport system permease small subunit